METKKIAIACFVGAAIGTGVALIVVPLFWWLGMLAGFGAGYLCYDFKEVQNKAPIAWEAAKKGSRYSLNWLKTPHPFLCLYLIPILVLTYAFAFCALKHGEASFGEKILFGLFLSILINTLITTIAAALVKKEAKRKRCFWQPSVSRMWLNVEITRMIEEGYTQIYPSYRNIYGLLITGLGHIVWSTIAAMPRVVKAIGMGLLYLLRFLLWNLWVFVVKFFWILLKLIHSQKRVLCGIDSAIGVAIAYFWFGAKATTPEQKVVVVICGGIIGAAIGVLNFEIISRRLLHLPLVKNRV